ncbi:putative defense protein Hdd11 [Littorina saxatilis]|uniref:Reelin domain-containing protein n=1 Tax=Littorina saxatilis TaxID=31220 RepID=A0AAN9G9B9_9CAEN
MARHEGNEAVIKRRNDWIVPEYCTLAMMSLVVSSSRGYPTGAPTSVCHSMFPHHGVTPKTQSPPYSIEVGCDVYHPGQMSVPVSVLSSDEGFKGLILQARSISPCEAPVGTFVLAPDSDGLQLFKCCQSNDTVTHKDGWLKRNGTVVWIPPAIGSGHVYFQATVVQSKSVLWNTVRSRIVYQTTSDPSAVNTCQPPSTLDAAQKLDGPHSRSRSNIHDDHSHHDNGDHTADDHSHNDHSHDEHAHKHKVRQTKSGASFSFSCIIVMTSSFFVALVL